jgi:hypothetical protein
MATHKNPCQRDRTVAKQGNRHPLVHRILATVQWVALTAAAAVIADVIAYVIRAIGSAIGY